MKKTARQIMRIEISPKAKAQLNTLSDRHGMTQVAMMSRMVDFFATQDELIQPLILGVYPKPIVAEVAELICKHIASKERSKA